MTTIPPYGPSGPGGPGSPGGPGHPGGPAMPAASERQCTWHPDRATVLSCSRCGRPACAECLMPASVGFHCRACVAEARAASAASAPRTVVGARMAGGRAFRPRITYGLIAINLLVFVVIAAQARSLSNFNPSSVYFGSALVPMVVADGEWWRLITSGFLHLSISHIALNMLALYFVGPGLERVLGTWRYLSLYLLSLLGGSAAVMLFAAHNSVTGGASGAIFGLMGALLVTLKRLKLDMRQAGTVIALNLIATFAIPGISWQAHLGGLVVGALVGAALVYAPAANRLRWQVAACVGVGVVLIALIVVKDATLGEWVCANTTNPNLTCYSPN